jgi:hypothetical protein
MWWVLGVVAAAALLSAYLGWTAHRVERVHVRAESAKRALEAHLLRRAAAAAVVAEHADATELYAAARLALDAEPEEREAAENNLTRQLQALPFAALAQAALSQAGLSQVALSESGLSESGLSESGLSESGLSESGLSESGLSRSGLSRSALEQSDLAEAAFPLAALAQSAVPPPAFASSDFPQAAFSESIVPSQALPLAVVPSQAVAPSGFAESAVQPSPSPPPAPTDPAMRALIATSRRAVVARQVHTDLVRDALTARHRPLVRMLGMARRYRRPAYFDIAEPTLPDVSIPRPAATVRAESAVAVEVA